MVQKMSTTTIHVEKDGIEGIVPCSKFNTKLIFENAILTKKNVI
jgi:hypothetical protein